MLPTLVPLDRHCAVNAPAATWEDARAEPEVAILRNSVGADHLYRITGHCVDGRYLAPMHPAGRRTIGQRPLSRARKTLFDNNSRVNSSPSALQRHPRVTVVADRTTARLLWAAGTQLRPRSPQRGRYLDSTGPSKEPSTKRPTVHTKYAQQIV